MKKLITYKILVLFFALAGIAFAATTLFSFNVAPGNWGSGSGSAYGVSDLYLSVIPSINKPSYSNRVLVYDNGSLIYSGVNVVTSQLLLLSYSSDQRHDYVLIIQNTDNCTFTGQILYN